MLLVPGLFDIAFTPTTNHDSTTSRQRACRASTSWSAPWAAAAHALRDAPWVPQSKTQHHLVPNLLALLDVLLHLQLVLGGLLLLLLGVDTNL